MKPSYGSNWGIWDFHIHTPHSKLNNGFGEPDKEETWVEYITKLDKVTKEKGIVALGITDYCSIDGYEKIIEIRKNAKLEADKIGVNDYYLKDVFLFPNIEFRIKPVTKSGRSINLHVLFNPVIADFIESDFLARLLMKTAVKDYYCTRKDLIALGRETKNNVHAEEEAALKEGINQFKTDSDSIRDILTKNLIFKRNALIGVSNSNNDGLAGIAENSLQMVRRNICYHADFILSPRDTDRIFYLGLSDKYDREVLENNFRTPKPCIHGSDAHNLEDLCSPTMDRYCWIKAQPTWEGLRQILYEPASRVHIGKDDPTPGKSGFSITNISISETEINNELIINQHDQPINPNLVTIIGGRGSGKTALLDLIASCFREGQKLTSADHKSSFIQRAVTNKGKRKEPVFIPVNIEFLSGETFRATVGQENDYFQESDIDYLTQNHFEDIASNSENLHEYILDLFFNSFPEDKVLFEDYQAELQSIQDEINEKIQEMVFLKTKVENNLQPAILDEMQKKGALKDIEYQIKEWERLNFEKSFSDAKYLDQIVNEIEEEKSKASRILLNGESIMTLIDKFRDDYREDSLSFNALIYENNIYSSIGMNFQSIDDAYDKLINNCAIAKAEETGYSDLIEALKDIRSSYDGADKTLSSYYISKKNINDEIHKIQSNISIFNSDKERANKLKEDICKTFHQLIEKSKEQNLFLSVLIEKYQKVGVSTIGNVSFVSKLTFNKDSLMDNIQEDLHLVKSRTDLEKISGLYDTLVQKVEENEDYYPIIDELSSHFFNPELKRNINRESFIKHLFERTFDNRIQACLEGKPLEHLSMGERAVVLLKIVLSLGNKPLLIDQPEEHLDNRYVYSELVPTIREIRNNRQIIIATHNANLVVNTDAEQIIVADYIDGKISYKSGALEDDDIRESIKSILEGGDEAFKRREQKYNLG